MLYSCLTINFRIELKNQNDKAFNPEVTLWEGVSGKSVYCYSCLITQATVFNLRVKSHVFTLH